MRHDVCGYVLAGGRSSRMGADKALLEVDGEPLLEHALRKLRTVCSRVRVLSGPRNDRRDAILARKAPLVPDLEGGHAGPLAGLAAALADCNLNYVLVLGVDQPNLPMEGLLALVNAGVGSGSGVACFSVDGQPEALPMLVSRKMSASILAALASGERRLLESARACAAWTGHNLLLLPYPGAASDAFLNLNTSDDLAACRRTRKASNPSARSASE